MITNVSPEDAVSIPITCFVSSSMPSCLCTKTHQLMSVPHMLKINVKCPHGHALSKSLVDGL